ncbi:MAG TPA: hypothetical protein VND70_09960 [Acidimicrobiales bacterium]|nr:hypothetical protein [Acidimicrobiales bacterium]
MVVMAPAVAHRGGTESRAGRDDVLALLRNGSGQRPRFDPGLAGGLRAWLEDAACEVVTARGDGAPVLFLGARQLLGEPGNGVGEAFSWPMVTACLVHALFRQIVLTGSVGDPLSDGTGALRVDPGRAGLVRHIEALPAPEREALAGVLAGHVAHLTALTPHFAPGWLPRTDDRVAIPLAGGRVVLHGVFDLLVGAPVAATASQCALGLTSGGPWERAWRVLHYLALLETLRSGTPPFRLALIHSASGRTAVEDVREEHLRAVVAHLVARLSGIAGAHG